MSTSTRLHLWAALFVVVLLGLMIRLPAFTTYEQVTECLNGHPISEEQYHSVLSITRSEGMASHIMQELKNSSVCTEPN